MTAAAPAGTGHAVAPEQLGQLDCLRLRTADGASLLISCFGAQVLSWQPAGGAERLFLSARAALDGRLPIRGGVPLVFPQFANQGPLPAHGLVRTALWQWQVSPQGSQQVNDSASVLFTLQDNAASRAQWPQAFGCQLSVHLGGPTMAITWHVHNSGPQALRFQAALHTYLRVDDAGNARIEGLQEAAYLDRWADNHPGVQREALLGFADGLDRIYPDAPARLLLHEPTGTLEITSQGFPDVVVWNPGPQRAAAVVDLQPGGQHQMVCIEAAAVARPVTLPTGHTWAGSQRLTVVGPQSKTGLLP